MTENGLDIQTISTKRIDKQADHVLLFGEVTEKIEKANPSHFLKFLLASRTNGTFGFARHISQPFAKPKEPFFVTAPMNNNNFTNVIFEYLMTNQNPEQIARDNIDRQLIACGWIPDPDLLANDIIENLKSGIESFEEIMVTINGK
jgi:hypothetical protein